MKYSSKQYAAALLEALRGRPDKEHSKIMRNFLVILAKNGERSKLSSIIRDAERGYYKELGFKKVVIETTSKASPAIKKEVQRILGKKISISEKINPELLAGIKILIDDSILIDASAQSKIQRMLNI